MINNLMPYPPSQQWLYSFCSKNSIILKNQETLEAARNGPYWLYGRKDVIESFYRKNGHLFLRNNRLLWNVDGTSSSSIKRFKVLCEKEGIPLTEIDKLTEHYTGLFPFNAAGIKLKPTIFFTKHFIFAFRIEKSKCSFFFLSKMVG